MSLGEYLGAGSGITKGLYRLSDLNDASGNSNTLAKTNTVNFVAGKFNNCADFGTTDNHTNALSTANVDGWADTSPTTMACWIKVRTKPAAARFILGWNRSAATAGRLALQYSNTQLIMLGGATTIAYTVDLGTTLWHYVVGTKASGATGNCRLYLDGILVAGPSAYSGNASTVAGKVIGNNLLTNTGCAAYIDEAIFELQEWTAQMVQRYYAWALGRYAAL